MVEPSTEVARELPASWRIATLGGVARWGSGGTPKAGTARYYGGEIPWAVIGDLTDGVVLDTATKITALGLCESSAKMVSPGTLLIAMYGSIGKLGIAGAPMATNQAIAFAIPHTGEVTPIFLFHYFRSQREAFGRAGKGATQQNISQTILKAWPVPVPPIREQERIVEVLEEQLSRLDAALASIKAVRAKADQFRRSVLHAGFAGELTGHSDEEWPTATLNDLVTRKSDIVDGPFGSNLKSAHYVDDGARVVRLQNIGFGEFVPGDAYITLDHFETLAKHNVKEGDLLFASLGENLPRACLAPRFEEPAIVKADCIRVRLRPEVNPRFVLHATQRPEAKHWASEALHGMGRPRLGLGTIRTFPVPLPPRSVQDQVVAAVEAELSRLAAVLTGANRAEFACAALRRSLLHAAFTGKLTEEWRDSHG